MREQRVALEDGVDRPLVGRHGGDVVAVDAAPGRRSGRSNPAIMRSVVVLPQPDGPEQGEELAGLDLEIDAGHRHLVGEALLQALERDGPTARQLAGAAAVAHWRCSSARLITMTDASVSREGPS